MKLTSAPDSTLFDLYVSRDLNGVYDAMARQLQELGYDATEDKVRRELKKRLDRRGFLPTDRPPTIHDYKAFRQRWRERGLKAELT